MRSPWPWGTNFGSPKLGPKVSFRLCPIVVSKVFCKPGWKGQKHILMHILPNLMKNHQLLQHQDQVSMIQNYLFVYSSELQTCQHKEDPKSELCLQIRSVSASTLHFHWNVWIQNRHHFYFLEFAWLTTKFVCPCTKAKCSLQARFVI